MGLINLYDNGLVFVFCGAGALALRVCSYFVIPEVLIGNPGFFCFRDKELDSRFRQ